VDISQVKPRQRKYTTDAPASKTPVQIAGMGKVPVGTTGNMNDHANGYVANGTVSGYANGRTANGVNGTSAAGDGAQHKLGDINEVSRSIPAQVPGEEVANGGTSTANDPLATAPAGGHPRDGGTGTEQSQTAPNMADLEPGKGGAN
jgi:hypothetical protein